MSKIETIVSDILGPHADMATTTAHAIQLENRTLVGWRPAVCACCTSEPVWEKIWTEAEEEELLEQIAEAVAAALPPWQAEEVQVDLHRGSVTW